MVLKAGAVEIAAEFWKKINIGFQQILHVDLNTLNNFIDQVLKIECIGNIHFYLKNQHIKIQFR